MRGLYVLIWNPPGASVDRGAKEASGVTDVGSIGFFKGAVFFGAVFFGAVFFATGDFCFLAVA